MIVWAHTVVSEKKTTAALKMVEDQKANLEKESINKLDFQATQ